MAYADIADVQKGLFFGLFANHAEAKVEQFRRKAFANTVRQLEQLNDDQLADIGVPRREIKQRAYRSVYHKKPYNSQA